MRCVTRGLNRCIAPAADASSVAHVPGTGQSIDQQLVPRVSSHIRSGHGAIRPRHVSVKTVSLCRHESPPCARTSRRFAETRPAARGRRGPPSPWPVDRIERDALARATSAALDGRLGRTPSAATCVSSISSADRRPSSGLRAEACVHRADQIVDVRASDAAARRRSSEKASGHPDEAHRRGPAACRRRRAWTMTSAGHRAGDSHYARRESPRADRGGRAQANDHLPAAAAVTFGGDPPSSARLARVARVARRRRRADRA